MASFSSMFSRPGAERLRATLLRWRTPAGIAIGTKIALFLSAWSSYQTRADERFGSVLAFFTRWNDWDSPRYLQIARDGYVSSGEDAKNIVFYPLYPALVAVANWFVSNQIVAALIVSTLASIAVAIAFWELVRLDHPEELATRAVLLLFCFPTGYFLHIYYTESVYLLCAVGFWLAWRARGERGHPLALATIGVLAGLARVNGLSLALAAGAEGLWKKKRWTTLLAAGTPAIGFGLYLLANRYVQGSFFAYEGWLSSYWHKSFEMPWRGLWNLVQPYSTDNLALRFTHALTEPISWFVAFGLLLGGLRRQPMGYSLYSFINLMLFVSMNFIMSTPRYILVLFPQYIVMARWLDGRPVLAQTVLLLMFGFQLTYATHFLFGQWAF